MPEKKLTGEEIVNLKIKCVSYVDEAANNKPFFIKSKNGEKQADNNVNIGVEILCNHDQLTDNFSKEFKKSADENKTVIGLVYEPNTADAHGQWMTEDTITKAMESFMIDSQNMDLNHNFIKGFGSVVQCYQAPVEFELNGYTVLKGSWLLGTKPTVEVRKMIDSGEITGYSLAGSGEVVDHDLTLKALIAKSAYSDNREGRLIRERMYSLDDSISYRSFNTTEDIAAIIASVDDFSKDVKKVLNAKLKTIKKNKGANMPDENVVPTEAQLEKFLIKKGVLADPAKAVENKLVTENVELKKQVSTMGEQITSILKQLNPNGTPPDGGTPPPTDDEDDCGI